MTSVSPPQSIAPPGRRAATKEANRAAILRAGREVFADLGYGAATVRDIVRRTDLATGTFYNYFPDKEAVLRTLVDGIAAEARRRVRAARRAATTADGFVRDGYRAYFGFIADDPQTFALLRRNAGTIRTLFGEPVIGAGIQRSAGRPGGGESPRALCRPTTSSSWRRPWWAPASRWAWRCSSASPTTSNDASPSRPRSSAAAWTDCGRRNYEAASLLRA
jgi:AcrR family transcriptional regulator